jgi:tRNA1(Val) A37 N6-methylase TrmN6
MDLGQVFTKEIVANLMVSLLEIDKNSSILDPCFGSGAFIDALLKQGFSKITGFELDKKLFELKKSQLKDVLIYNQDFLNSEIKYKYNGIIMNPPYIRHEKIDDLSNLGISKKILRKNEIFNKLPKNANLYMYFLIKAIDLLADDGKIVVIFPSSWMRAKNGQLFEKILYSKCTLKKQLHIYGEIFEKKAMVDVFILVLVKGHFKYIPELKYLEVKKRKIIEKKQFFNYRKIDFPVKFFNYAKIKRGITTGYNKFFINPRFKNSMNNLVPIISSPKSILGFSSEKANYDHLFVANENDLQNKEIKDYVEKWKDIIIKSEKPKSLFNKINNSKNWFSLKSFDCNGFLFGYFVRNEMKFIYNFDGFLARDNFYIIIPLVDKNLFFSLLNNYYTFFQLERLGKNYGSGLLKLQKYDLEELYFPNIKDLSIEDKNKLIFYSKKLLKNLNYDLIKEITKIISKYSKIGFKEIEILYENIKKNRLGEYR